MTTSARRMRRSSHGGRWSWFPRAPVRVREPREARCSFGRRRSSARLAIPGKRWPPTGLRLPSTGGGSRPSGCLELDAIRRPVPSTEAPCQHRGRTAVRSRRQGFWPIPASAKRTGGSLVGVGSAQEGSRPGRHAEPGSTPRAATRSGPLPNLAPVCARRSAGTPCPCPSRHRFRRRRRTRRSRCRIRCRRPTRSRPESRIRSRRPSSEAVSHRRAAHGRAECHVQV